MATDEPDKRATEDVVDHRLTKAASNIVDDEPATVRPNSYRSVFGTFNFPSSLMDQVGVRPSGKKSFNFTLVSFKTYSWIGTEISPCSS